MYPEAGGEGQESREGQHVFARLEVCVGGGEWFLHPLRLVTGTCGLNGQKTHEQEKGLFHIHTGSLTKKKKPLKSNEAGSLYTMLTEGNKRGKVTRQRGLGLSGQ